MVTTTPAGERLLLRPPEAAARLSVSLRTLHRMVADGSLPTVRLHDRCLRFAVTTLEEYVRSRETRAAMEPPGK